MADDWDAEDFDVDKGFADESKEEEEEDLALAEVVVPEPQAKPKTEATKPQKSKQERINEKKAQRRAMEIADTKSEDDVSKLSAAEERRRREELQKESDLRLAMETFGGAAAAGTLDAMDPKTEDDFSEFKDALADKITKYGASAHYNAFLEKLLIKCCNSLDAGDLRHLSTVLSTMAAEKQKAKSSKTSNKKKGKASLGSRAVGKGSKRLDDMEYENELGAEFDDFI